MKDTISANICTLTKGTLAACLNREYFKPFDRYFCNAVDGCPDQEFVVVKIETNDKPNNGKFKETQWPTLAVDKEENTCNNSD